MGPLRLWLRYAGVSLRAQMQYPASTFGLVLGQFAVTVIELTAVFSLFARFGQVRGWTLGEMAFFYGLTHIGFALSELISRGFDVFGPAFVKTGNFDRILLRPRSAALQLMGYEMRLSRLGRLVQGAAVLVIGTNVLHFHWDLMHLAYAAWALVGTVALFLGLFVLQAVLAFWTVDGLEIANALTHGGVQSAQYPLSIYAAWLRAFLTFVVPLACVAYFPVVGLLGRPEPLGAPPILLPLAPLAGFAFLAASFLAWRGGVARYTSTGS